MRKKIDQLLNGKFEYQEKPPVISAQRIDQTGSSLSPVTGSFTVSSADDRKLRGFAYSSNPRVSFEPVQFYARETKISYQADLTGLVRMVNRTQVEERDRLSDAVFYCDGKTLRMIEA